MSISQRYHTDRSHFALELTMRDALAGLEELAHHGSIWFDPNCLEILSIDPPQAEPCPVTPSHAPTSAKVLSFPELRRRTG